MSSHPTTIGRYEVVSRLAQGGMGALYLAWDPRLDRQIAVKVLMHDDDELRERFAREARSAARLRHPHIVTIFDVGEHEDQPFIAMEFIQGQTLGAMIRARTDLPVVRKLKLAEELCDGLGFAHKSGVIHRDVKPANAIVDAHGSLKILDFGIARLGDSCGMTQAGFLVGTLNYMSPEQLMGRPADSRSDIFAVGAVVYEMLACRQAFPGGLENSVITRIVESPPAPLDRICEGLDPEIVRIVNRALEKEPSRRYQDLGHMAQDLQRVRVRLDWDAGNDRPPAATPTPTPRSVSSLRAADREELRRRRLAEIETHLDAARRAIGRGEPDVAIERCEEALLLDADHDAAAELLEQARAAQDEHQAEDLLTDAESHLRLGALTAAQVLVERAGALCASSSRVASLRTAVEDALQKREQARRLAQNAADVPHETPSPAAAPAAPAAPAALALTPEAVVGVAGPPRAVPLLRGRAWLAAGAGVVAAAVVIAVLLLRTGDVSPPAPGADTSAAARSEQQLEGHRSHARRLLAGGDLQAALESAASGLSISPRDSELTQIAQHVLASVTARVDAARKDAAALAGRNPPRAFREADALRASFLEQQKAGQLAQAVQTGVSAASRFTAFADTRRTDDERRVAKEKRDAEERVRFEEAERERLAIESQRVEREEIARRAAEAQARREAEERGRAAAAEKASRDAEKALKDAEEQARRSEQERLDRAAAERARLAQIEEDKRLDAERAAAKAAADRDADRRAVEAVVQAYVQGYASRSASAVKGVFPSADDKLLADRFASLRSQQVSIQGSTVEIKGQTATVSGQWVAESVDRFGQKQQGSSPFRLQLQKSGDSWLILSRH